MTRLTSDSRPECTMVGLGRRGDVRHDEGRRQMSWRTTTLGVLAGVGLAMATVVPASAHELIIDNGHGVPGADHD